MLGIYASDLVSNTMWQIILDHVLSLLVVIVTPVLLVMLQNFLKNRNIPIQQAVLESIVDNAVHFAESAGHAALKKGEHLEGNEKLEAALSYVDSETKRLGLDTLAKDALTKVVEAQLAKVKPYLPQAPEAPEVSADPTPAPEEKPAA